MISAKVTSKGQITIPIEVRRIMDLKAGDQIFFDIKDVGVVINKTSRPLTIQERFAGYDLQQESDGLAKQMKEIDEGGPIGKENI